MPSKLQQLKNITEVVADTGNMEAIRRYAPVDATTNPSLLLKVAGTEEYRHLMATARSAEPGDAAAAADRLAVTVGAEILKLIGGRVSTEVDARLSFDTEATVRRAHRLVELYDQLGAHPNRVLIKVAATWEGIRAAQQLEKAGVRCNLTLLFGFTQAAAGADAGVTLISPFVGRILDWYRARDPAQHYDAESDPGVQSVRRIYNYYKAHGYNTIIMGASFRNMQQIEGLAGCDRLTISPELLQELNGDHGELQRQLSSEGASSGDPPMTLREADFRYRLNDDAMATEKLAEGIRRFAADQVSLERQLAETTTV